MKKIFSALMLTLAFKQVIACCAGGLIEVSPRGNEISQNPIILIDFMERDYKVYDLLLKATFYLVDENGGKINLDIIETNKAFNTGAQALLRPRSGLEMEQIVSIKIEGLNVSDEKIKKFINHVQSKKWSVCFDKDTTIPKFNQEVTHEYINHFGSSASGHGILGNVVFWDNNEYTYQINNRKEKQILLEVTSKEGNKYIIQTHSNSFWIYDGICGSTFELKQDTEYSFEIRLIDLSGNKSDETKQVKFKTGNYRLHRIANEDIISKFKKN
jgi:hypothetical protein